MTRTAAEALREAVQQLKPVLQDQAARDARLLLADALVIDPGRLTAVLPDPIHDLQLAKFNSHIERRLRRQPVSQILGRRMFWGRSFRVTEDVLDPRPDTETLIELAMQGPAAKHILDLGTGSGCILLTLLEEWPDSRGTGADVSGAALAVASENAENLGVEHRCTLLLSDWFNEVGGRYDLVVSNPPYITANEMQMLGPEVADWEPSLALTPGGDGLSAYRKIADHLSAYLAPKGRGLFEIGKEQGKEVTEIFRSQGFQDVSVHRDINGFDRVISVATPMSKHCG
ncbi:MAG: peptide chain release factor N(5)-glutamine methyltransferase [Rhodobacteraceae bacterium]|nr:peptide chain release factor N(5)-glutamine methyltransferase [Paracoccaceae bacterium]